MQNTREAGSVAEAYATTPHIYGLLISFGEVDLKKVMESIGRRFRKAQVF